MSKKKITPQNDFGGLVYSTNPNISFGNEPAPTETLNPADQKLRIKLETKYRGGKTVTLITGFIGLDEAIENLGKQLKTTCGTGGSVKDGEIIIQGDHREKVLQWLQKNNYKQTKKL